jgi:hypothetical protein
LPVKRVRRKREENGVDTNVNTACLLHIDWHENPKLGLQVCAILDDSSRMIIAAREYVHCNTQNIIEVIDELVREYWNICPLRESY